MLGRPSQLGYVVNNHGDRFCPKWGYSPYKWPNFMATYKWSLLTTYDTWDDPPGGANKSIGKTPKKPTTTSLAMPWQQNGQA